MDVSIKPHKFDPFLDNNASSRWKSWINEFEIYLLAEDITNDVRKRALLLNCAGSEVIEIFQSLPDSGKTYDEAKTALYKFFVPDVNVLFEIFQFRNAKQEPGEKLMDFYLRLRKLVSTCNFHDKDLEIKIQILLGTNSDHLRKEMLKNPNKTLKEVLSMGQAEEMVKSQISCFKDLSLENVNKLNKGRICYACGGVWPHSKNTCPAKGKKCHACGEKNHFPGSKYCQSSSSNKGKKLGKQYKGSVNQTRDTDDACNSSSSGGEDADRSLNVSYFAKSGNLPTTEMYVLGKKVEVIVDTGCSVNLINKSVYDSLENPPKLQPTKCTLLAYQAQPINVLGKFKCYVTHKSQTKLVKFVVVEGGDSLLSCETAKDFGIVSLALNIVPSEKLDSEKQKLVMLYPNLFNGVGKFKSQQVKLHVDPNIAPVAVSFRRTPIHLRKQVEVELNKLLEDDIIEKVDGPTSWVSPMVIVPKKDGSLRICVDMRAPNKAIRRERFPVSTINDVVSVVNGSTLYSKLDLNKGFHQLELAPDSRDITTFATHLGLFRYKRLSFGICSAPEKFHQIVRQTISNIPGCINVSDDILVFGKTDHEHDRALHSVLCKLQQSGLTLNVDKCMFRKASVPYLGFNLSKNGISPDEEKLSAIENLETPRDAHEMRSCLGMLNFLQRFIPHLANDTHVLRRLIKKETDWRWTEVEEECFNNIKVKVKNAISNQFFDMNKTAHIYVDAGPEGLGAIIAQPGKDCPAIVACASVSLSEVQKRYSQIEREMLAITWSVQHWSDLLMGAKFVIHTDHKPLVSLLSRSKGESSPRLDRLMFKLLGYDFTVEHISGKENPSDYMSRHPLRKKLAGDESYINFVTEINLPSTISREELSKFSQQDVVLRKLTHAIKTNQWNDQDLQSYKVMKNELSVTMDNIVLRGSRIVVPFALQDRVLALAHRGHQGMTKGKELLRSKVWFPKMNKRLEILISKCIPCLANSSKTSRDPIKPTPIPSGPWETLSLDFAGPFPNGKYVAVLIDDFSRYPLAEVISSLTTSVVTRWLFKAFSLFGIPSVLRTDNGPPFNGHQFTSFCERLGIQHKKVTSLWPEANGRVEHFMSSLNKTIRIALIENRNWEDAILEFLIQYRATPHCATKTSPSNALIRSTFRTFLPQLNTNLFCDDIDEQLVENDRIAKDIMKDYADSRRKTKDHELQCGDRVLAKQPKKNKYSTPFNPVPMEVVDVQGTRITATSGEERLTRNASHFKKLPNEEDDSINGQFNNENENDEKLSKHSGEDKEVRKSKRDVNIPTKFKDFVLY